MGLMDRVKSSAAAAAVNGEEPERKPAPTPEKELMPPTLRQSVHERLIEELGEDILFGDVGEEKTRKAIASAVENLSEEQGMPMPRLEREKVIDELADEILGLGPIETYVRDADITEIMVNGPSQVYIERGGRIHLTPCRFKDKTHVLRIIEKIVSPLGRRIDESSPMVDARLPDGSRVNAIIPPLSLVGPCLTIRKFARVPLQVDDLVRFGTMTRETGTFLDACVRARLNILVSGGTGSGKTTTLNVLSSFIPDDERIVTVEDAAELQLRQAHVVTLEARPPNIEGKGAVTIRDLVRNCLRMRPDRIVVGEVRGGEALDMLQAMNTGHDGSLTTAHANSPRDALARIETMVLMSGMDLPLRAIREQVASALDLIVHQERLKDGTRRITHLTEVQGMENSVITLQDIFKYESKGVDENGKFIGELKPMGIVPKFIDQFKAAGIKMPLNVFTGL